MRVDPRAVFIRLNDVVGADRHQPAVTDFHFAVQLHQPLGLAPILRAKPSPTEHHDHGIRSLHFGKFAACAPRIPWPEIGKTRPTPKIPPPTTISALIRFILLYDDNTYSLSRRPRAYPAKL